MTKATPPPPSPSETALVRVRQDFHAWLRIEAAKQGTTIMQLLEIYAASAHNGRAPWRKR